MFEKIEILFIILVLLLLFYLVISLGAGNKKGKSSSNPEISRYLSGVRILIIILAMVAFILWIFGFVS